MRPTCKTRLGSLVELPPDKKTIGCKWVYRTKFKVDGSVDKYKIKLVAKGYAQHDGINYEETFQTSAPKTKLTTIRLLLAMVAWLITKSVFLNGDKVFMEAQQGFFVKVKKSWYPGLLKHCMI